LRARAPRLHHGVGHHQRPPGRVLHCVAAKTGSSWMKVASAGRRDVGRQPTSRTRDREARRWRPRPQAAAAHVGKDGRACRCPSLRRCRRCRWRRPRPGRAALRGSAIARSPASRRSGRGNFSGRSWFAASSRRKLSRLTARSPGSPARSGCIRLPSTSAR
jgi:hypothetical protein